MRWETWVLVSLIVISTLMSIARHTPRPPMEDGAKVIFVIIQAGVIWLVLRSAGAM